MIAGVDGCREGWIAAIESTHGDITVDCFKDVSEILSREELKLVVIDVPIGLTEAGPRSADKEARALLGRRHVSVFRAPIRPILDCSSREVASEKWRSIEGKGVSAQLWSIVPKIVEVDRIMKTDPTLQKRIWEGHPEVSFALMNSRTPLPLGKAKREGQALRQKLLAKQFEHIDDWVSRYLRFRIDVVDAFSLLWTARRVTTGSAESFPKSPKPDKFGLYPRVVA